MSEASSFKRVAVESFQDHSEHEAHSIQLTNIERQLNAILDELKTTRKQARKHPVSWRDMLSALAVVAGLMFGGLFGYYTMPAYYAVQQANDFALQGLHVASLANVLTLTSMFYSAPQSQPVILNTFQDAKSSWSIPTFPACVVDLYEANSRTAAISDSTLFSEPAGDWTSLINAIVPPRPDKPNVIGDGKANTTDLEAPKRDKTSHTFIGIISFVGLVVLFVIYFGAQYCLGSENLWVPLETLICDDWKSGDTNLL